MAERRHNYQTVAWFWDQKLSGRLDMDPPYQRRSVWNQAYKDEFLDSVLMGYPAPGIFLHEELDAEGRVTYHVVDGRQRLGTLFEFREGRFPVGDSATKTELRGLYYDKLDLGIRESFWRYEFPCEYLGTTNSAAIDLVFNRLNKNVAKLSRQELRHARFDGVFIRAAEDLSRFMVEKLNDQFPRIVSQSRRQMKDVEFVATLMLLLESGARSHSQDELDEAFSERDVEWEQEDQVAGRFRKAVEVIHAITRDPGGESLLSTRLRNQADFYSLFGAVDALDRTAELPVAPECASRLVSFIELVDSEEGRMGTPAAAAFYEAARSASNDAGPRAVRIGVLTAVLAGRSWKPPAGV
jgi:hypothetical protein